MHICNNPGPYPSFEEKHILNKRCEVYENAETSPWVNQFVLVRDVVLKRNVKGTQPVKVNNQIISLWVMDILSFLPYEPRTIQTYFP